MLEVRHNGSLPASYKTDIRYCDSRVDLGFADGAVVSLSRHTILIRQPSFPFPGHDPPVNLLHLLFRRRWLSTLVDPAFFERAMPPHCRPGRRPLEFGPGSQRGGQAGSTSASPLPRQMRVTLRVLSGTRPRVIMRRSSHGQNAYLRSLCALLATPASLQKPLSGEGHSAVDQPQIARRADCLCAKVHHPKPASVGTIYSAEGARSESRSSGRHQRSL
jgi:hypothetical protein